MYSSPYNSGLIYGREGFFMKNNILTMGRYALSLLLVFAVVAVSLFTAITGANISAGAATVNDTWDGTQATGFASGSGTKDDPYIIANAEQMAYAALSTTLDSKGKYFKVIDNAVFNMNGMAGITLDSTAEQVQSATKNDSYKWNSESSTFAGNFDGNGAVIYNIYANDSYAGLFPKINTNNTDKSVAISNITVKASCIIAYHYAGGIVGLASASTTSQRLNFSQCAVVNCYITDNNSTNPVCERTSGTIAGAVGHNGTTINNCLAKDNILVSTNIKGGFIGNTSGYSPDVRIMSSISIGTLPYPTLMAGSTKTLESHATAVGGYNDIYTDQVVNAGYTGIKTLANADMIGAVAKVNMPNLDWSQWIAFDGEYPDFRLNHTLVTVSNGESGHTVKCLDCGKSINETHNLVEDIAALVYRCDCGYTTPITEIKDTWDGTQATGFASGSGTKDDPYIIANAEQMAYAALSTTLDSKGKYFKIIDNAVFNMNGMMNITLDSTADQVKNATRKESYKWNSESSTFAGNFDGNGAIIYNVYTNSAYAGLFPKINTNNTDKSVTISNITVKASCFIAYHNAGGIVGLASASTTSQKLNFSQCAVVNCYITDNNSTNPVCERTSGTIAGSVAHNGTTVENCLAKGNLLVSTDIKGGFIGNTSGYSPDVRIMSSISIGTLPYPTLMAGSSKTLQSHATAVGGYSDIYTDCASASAYRGVKTLTIAQMTGEDAVSNMNLDFSNVWFANTGTPELQVSHNLKGSVYSEDNYLGHNAYCDRCSMQGIMVTGHSYNDQHICTICGFECDHQNEDYITVIEDLVGDCVTAPNTQKICNCGYIERQDFGTAPGHNLIKTDAVAATCAKDGNIEYWTCSECNKIFLTDDIMAPMSAAVSQESVIIAATGAHVELRDSNGDLVYGMNGKNHWTYCAVCQTQITKAAHDIVYTDNGENGHSGKCSVCLYEAAKDEAHLFGDDAVCDICSWTCPHDTSKIVKVEAADPTCSTEGSYMHYRCTVCDLVFEDANATVPTTKDVVIIPKLGHHYVDLDQNGNPVYDYDTVGHWYNCTICGKGDYAEHILETDDKSYEGVYKWCEDAEGFGCDYSTFDYAYTNEDETVAVTATTNAFTKDVITDIFEITQDNLNREAVVEALATLNVKNFSAYEISPSQNMAAGGKATITMALPKTLGEDIAIYYIDVENGTAKMLDTKLITAVEKDEEKLIAASVTTDRFGFFAIAEVGLNPDGSVAGGFDGSASSGTGFGTDTGNNSPATGESVTPKVVAIAMLFGAVVLVANKAREIN